MHRATHRPYVTAGIAVLGAGLIALPAAAAMLVDASALPNVKVADVLLTSTGQDGAADAAAALANVTPDALATPDLNIAISIDGFTLLQDGSATATSDSGDFAIVNTAVLAGAMPDVFAASVRDLSGFAKGLG